MENQTIENIPYADIQEQQLIGEGSFGKVFKADYLGTEIAVKECFVNDDFDFKKYFQREVEMLKEARHPNVVQFMGLSITDKKFCIVTEFIQNGNLKDWIEHNAGKIEELQHFRMSISFCIDIAKALAYLHAKDVLHRDLKLENLLLTENYRVKVCDFGFSRLLAKTEQERQRLSFCGSDGYMSPEVVLCMGNYGKGVDIFAFAIIAISLFCLKIPKGDPHEDAPFKRLIPGFGLDWDGIDPCISSFLPNRPNLLSVLKSCSDEEADKRPQLKDILPTLKETEIMILSKIKEERQKMQNSFGTLNIGLFPADSNPNLNLSQSDFSKRNQSIHSPIEKSAVILTSTDNLNEKQMNRPHRFSIVISPLSINLKCQKCTKIIPGILHRHLICDECGFICHKKCARELPANCKSKIIE